MVDTATQDPAVGRWETTRASASDTATIALICRIVELHDPHTAAHHQRVAALATRIASELGLEPGDVESIGHASLIHDVGKIAVPAQILARPAPLTELEWQYLRAHSQTGYDLVLHIDSLARVAMTILQHHERLDGSGYPQGLRDDEIGIEPRVLAVADVVEAMASHRPYRNALGVQAALIEVSNRAGTLFDPGVVDACVKSFQVDGFTFPEPVWGMRSADTPMPPPA